MRKQNKYTCTVFFLRSTVFGALGLEKGSLKASAERWEIQNQNRLSHFWPSTLATFWWPVTMLRDVRLTFFGSSDREKPTFDAPRPRDGSGYLNKNRSRNTTKEYKKFKQINKVPSKAFISSFMVLHLSVPSWSIDYTSWRSKEYTCVITLLSIDNLRLTALQLLRM